MEERAERVATFLSAEEAELIRAEAKRRGLSLSAYIRSAVLEGIAQSGPKTTILSDKDFSAFAAAVARVEAKE